MLEIPEAITIAGQISETLAGKTVGRVIAAHDPHGFAFYNEPPERYGEMLEGRALTGAEAIAGIVEISFGEMRLLFFDGTTPRYFKAGETRPKKHQLCVEFTDGSCVICTIRMYGGMMVFPAGAYDNIYYLAAKEKPSPLGDGFSPEYFMDIVRACKPSTSAKALLATEQRIPGFGNGCLQDTLFNARMNPMSKLSSMPDGDFAALRSTLRETLANMTSSGGRDTEKDLFGNPGGYRSILSAKTLPFPCPACGGGITRRAFLGGNVYYCPQCQPVAE